MKAIERIAIFGAGAMGAAYARLFTDNSDLHVCFAARGDRFARLDGATINVNGRDYTIPVVHPDRVERSFDLVLVALKHHHLTESVLKDINALTGSDTLVLSVMNGLESEKLLGQVCGYEKIVPAIAVGIDAVHENNRFTFANPGKIIFGNDPDLSNADDTDRLEQIKSALDMGGIPNEISPDILRTMWWKFMVNVGVNQSSAVLGAPYGVFQNLPEARALMVALMQEVVALARHRGINLQPSDIDQWVDVLNTLSPDGKTSMLQDMEAKRKTEVEIFAGAVEVMGKEDTIPTPVNSTFLNLIRVKEKITIGKPEYMQPVV
ncbi:2-dehydropantoate 2-reductase [Desulfobacter hydrogenophilus]|uniref:2-dehydropantoate 2-reductase n=1 Tax=Desulfobacter hydrogenophilus TaxID=2291 RepID=A0A328FIE2_9BACT|nr:2-dehydropantoate 2-reductase [Desulfobacter hydrogenophilus]NDY71069.1 2-dehydropantoate 2-reductase [Desulfobacter hydrogenophilus]QBH11709.1 2-dehydropantoate 2-reductase [Desulfobacter hydrogenophilus]RAM02923.1 2-dehydropantoate 2-reductase [Desulfobacter hydrogenophilus]